MVDINLEDIKKRTSKNLSRYYVLDNRYRWKEFMYSTSDRKFRKIPLFDLPEDEINNENKIRMISYAGDTHWACFGRFIYHFHKQANSRILFEILPYASLISSTTNNHCWMTLEQLDYWIGTFKKETKLNFKYKIEIDKTRCHILLDFKRLSKLQMKYTLFWIRYTYEYPASFLALDAMLLKRDYYPDETLQNLLTLVSVCQRRNEVPLTSTQCITTRGDFIQPKELQRRIRTNTKLVTEIFGGMPSDYNKKTIYGIELPDFYNVQNITGESWIKNTERFDIYTTVYPKMKEHEIIYKERN